MIILEGPDGAGKTTLLSELQQHFSFPVADRVVSKDAEAMVDLQSWVEQNVRQGFQEMFFDRHRLVSEFIYGPVLRRHAEPGFTDVGWTGAMLQLFYHIRPVVIYCLPPLQVVKDNLRGDPDNERVNPHIEPIYQAYLQRAWMDRMINPYSAIYDYTTDGQEEDHLKYYIDLINEALRYAKYRASINAKYTPIER